MIDFLTKRFELKELRKFIKIFYAIGFLGFVIPYTFDFFTFLIPFALILSIFLLSIYHNNYDKKTLLVFFIIYSLGLLVEILGVNTGMIFGKYYYGNVLNPKILGTPLIIGLNWLFLVYVSTSIIDDLTINSIAKVFLASIIMVIYDVILEQVAGNLDMWYWYTDNIPLKNYISWFVIAVIFVSIIKFFKIETENKLSFTLLSTQFFFFLGLLIYFRAVQ